MPETCTSTQVFSNFVYIARLALYGPAQLSSLVSMLSMLFTYLVLLPIVTPSWYHTSPFLSIVRATKWFGLKYMTPHRRYTCCRPGRMISVTILARASNTINAMKAGSLMKRTLVTIYSPHDSQGISDFWDTIASSHSCIPLPVYARLVSGLFSQCLLEQVHTTLRS